MDFVSFLVLLGGAKAEARSEFVFSSLYKIIEGQSPIRVLIQLYIKKVNGTCLYLDVLRRLQKDEKHCGSL